MPRRQRARMPRLRARARRDPRDPADEREAGGPARHLPLGGAGERVRGGRVGVWPRRAECVVLGGNGGGIDMCWIMISRLFLGVLLVSFDADYTNLLCSLMCAL